MSAWFIARGLCAGYGESDVLREVTLEVRRGEPGVLVHLADAADVRQP